MRRESASLLSGSETGRWTLAAESLRSAYALLDKATGDRVSWWAALAQHEDDPSAQLGDSHHLESLLQLREALNLEQTTLGEMKVKAQDAADRRLAFVQLKLNPLQEDRDRVVRWGRAYCALCAPVLLPSCTANFAEGKHRGEKVDQQPCAEADVRGANCSLQGRAGRPGERSGAAGITRIFGASAGCAPQEERRAWR
jgi:hypothetical protein